MLFLLVVIWHVSRASEHATWEKIPYDSMPITSWSSYWESSNQVQTIRFAHIFHIYVGFDGVRQHHKLLCYILRSSHSVPITFSVRIYLAFFFCLRYVMIAWNIPGNCKYAKYAWIHAAAVAVVRETFTRNGKSRFIWLYKKEPSRECYQRQCVR